MRRDALNIPAIRPATSADDLKVIGQLFEAYAASLGIDLSYQDFATELATLPGKYAPPGGQLLLAMDAQGKPSGCVALRPLGVDELCCEMKRLYVSPLARGLGLGRALIEAIVNEAAYMGYREMRLDTLPGMSSAISLYKRAGFRPIEPYYDTPVLGTIFLGRQLGGVTAGRRQ